MLAVGRTEYWDVFQGAYRAVMQHYRRGPWYDDADIVTGRTLHQQFQSLQAFWPGAPLLSPSPPASPLSHYQPGSMHCMLMLAVLHMAQLYTCLHSQDGLFTFLLADWFTHTLAH